MINNTEAETFQTFAINSLPDLQQEMPKVAKHLITAKLSFSRPRYNELDIFRQQIEQSKAGMHHQPYTNSKKGVMQYRLIFCGLGLLFILLSVLSLYVSSAISFGLFLHTSAFLKSGLFSTSILLSFCSFILALTIRTEREAVLHCVRKAKAILNTIYSRKRIRLGIKRFFALFGPQRQRAQALKHIYHEIYDRISDKKEEALHLVHRIATSHTLDESEKEDLLNQALEELNEKLMVLTHNFRHTPLPHHAARQG